MHRENGGNVRRHLGLVARAGARGFGVWGVYAAVGVLLNWLTFAVTFVPLWGSADLGHAGHAGPVALLLLLFFPQFWVSMAFLLGFPLLCVLAGQKMGLKAALQTVLRERSDALTEAALSLSWPICEKVQGTAVAMSAGSVARALKSALDLLPDTSRATRWLLSAAMSAIRLEDLLTTTSFLGTMQTDPDGARGTLRTAIDERVRTAADGPLFRVLWLSLLASLALAVVSVAIVMRNR